MARDRRTKIVPKQEWVRRLNQHAARPHLYATADSYLKALADKSGGLLRADKVWDHFRKRSQTSPAELRTQYLQSAITPPTRPAMRVPKHQSVNSTRKNVAIRARPGYRAPEW